MSAVQQGYHSYSYTITTIYSSPSFKGSFIVIVHYSRCSGPECSCVSTCPPFGRSSPGPTRSALWSRDATLCRGQEKDVNQSQNDLYHWRNNAPFQTIDHHFFIKLTHWICPAPTVKCSYTHTFN